MEEKIIFDNYYKSSLIFILIIGVLLIDSKWLPIISSTLFFLLLLDMIDKYAKNKTYSIFISISALILILFSAFTAASYLSQNLDELLKVDLDQYKPILTKLGIKVPVNMDINFITKTALEYIKNNISILTSIGANSIQIIIGIILAISFFTYKDIGIPDDNWGKFINSIQFYFKHIFTSFKTIMKIQILVATLNTVTISFLSLVIAKLLTGEFMPYWYLLLPLSFILSLIPVIGNVIINIIIFIIAINVSIYFMIISIAYFFIMHKLELIIIGKILGHKTNLPFLLIALSMFIGELIFNSLLGILFGTISLLAMKSIMESFELREVIAYKNL